jgi:ketosteroid isomerase-like protein
MSKSNDACLAAHIAAENAHDVEAIMDTYGEGALVEINGRRFDGPASIRSLHESLGFGGVGTLAEISYHERQRFTAGDSIIVEGALEAIHAGDYSGLPASGEPVTIPFCAIYQFDSTARLASERVYLDIASALNRPGAG